MMNVGLLSLGCLVNWSRPDGVIWSGLEGPIHVKCLMGKEIGLPILFTIIISKTQKRAHANTHTCKHTQTHIHTAQLWQFNIRTVTNEIVKMHLLVCS